MVADLARTSSGLVSKAQPDVSQGVRRVVITDHVATLSQSTLKLPLLPFPWFLTRYLEAASHIAQVRFWGREG